MGHRTFRRGRQQVPASVDQIERALTDLDPNNPRNRAIARRWAHEDALPPLPDEEGLAILQNPLADYDSDTKARFRRWARGQPGGVEVYQQWILQRMRHREEKTK